MNEFAEFRFRPPSSMVFEILPEFLWRRDVAAWSFEPGRGRPRRASGSGHAMSCFFRFPYCFQASASENRCPGRLADFRDFLQLFKRPLAKIAFLEAGCSTIFSIFPTVFKRPLAKIAARGGFAGSPLAVGKTLGRTGGKERFRRFAARG